jgi:hypothetical protein
LRFSSPVWYARDKVQAKPAGVDDLTTRRTGLAARNAFQQLLGSLQNASLLGTPLRSTVDAALRFVQVVGRAVWPLVKIFVGP